MKLVGLRVIPIHYYVFFFVLVALALGIFAAWHGLDSQHFWHTVFIHHHGPVADDDFIHHH